MAPISLKKGKIDYLAVELIKNILDVKDGDPNIKVALDYVMSNFRYHRFLDINPLDVSKSLTGLTAKFRVNSQDKKAIYLENLVDKFVNQPLLEKHHGDIDIQTDAHYSLLCCLMKLSNNPLNSKFVPTEERKVHEEEDDSNQFDWTSYLLDGESDLEIGVEMEKNVESELYDSDEELWALSESEESEEDEIDPIYAEIGDLQINKKIQSEFRNTEKDIEWLKNNIVSPYWSEKIYFVLDKSQYKYGNEQTCNNWELYSTSFHDHADTNNYQVLTEIQLVRETLWMLQGIENLYIFKYNDQKYSINENIIVNHLTKGTLNMLVTKFTDVGSKIVELKLFSLNSAKDSDTEPKSLRAFGYVVSKFLREWRTSLSAIEQKVINKDEMITLAGLYDKLGKDFAKVNCIHQIYVETRVKGFQEYSLTTERVVHFLDVFYNALCTYDSLGDAGLAEMCLILPMFLDVCQPYLHDLDNWMTMGTLPHTSDEEFMIYRTEEKSHGNINFWSRTFRIKESMNKTLVPKFIEGVQKQILIAGKSLRLLSEFGKFSQSVVSAKTVFEQFKENLQEIISKSNERFLKGKDLPIGEYQIDGRLLLTDEQITDPLIQENFQNMFLDLYRAMKKDTQSLKGINESCEESSDWKRLLEHGSCRPPMKLLLEKSLHPVILERYNKASALLLELFKQEMNLFYHIDVMRDFYLMQAAGTMYEFYSEVFDKIKRGDYHEMSFLNIVLQDALQVQYPQLMGSLTLAESGASIQTYSSKLDSLSLHYKVPWPITIILTDEIQDQYNEIFRFLLKVKRAIWTLENLRFHELISGLTYLNKPEGETLEEDEPLRMSKRNDVILKEKSQQLLKMRMLTIRMKMLHVIRNFHFYLMTRIENTMQTEVEKKLKLATDLDEILTLHHSLLNSLIHKCFLHEKIARSREAIMRILNLVFDFEVLWVDGVKNVDVSKLNRVEKEFNRCTSFLHSFFSSLAKRGSYPHVEFLAHSLKTESQGHRALFRR